MNNVPDSIDLAADQCTLYFVDNTTLGRMNVCTGELVPPLTTSLPYFSQDLRILPDGSILVASALTMERFGPDGTHLRTYLRPASALALDIDGQSVWTYSASGLSKVDLKTGNVNLGPFTTSLGPVLGLAVYGEPRAALVASVPAMTPNGAIALALALVLIGIVALRRSW